MSHAPYGFAPPPPPVLVSVACYFCPRGQAQRAEGGQPSACAACRELIREQRERETRW